MDGEVWLIKKGSYTGILFILLFLFGCQIHHPNIRSVTVSDVETAFQGGYLTRAIVSADSLLKSAKIDSETRRKLVKISDLAGRIMADFSMNESETEEKLKGEFGNYSPDERALWEKNNWLESRMIDGQKRYFKRAVSNLKLILRSNGHTVPGMQPMGSDPFSDFCLEQSRKVIALGKGLGTGVAPVKIKVDYQVVVKPDAVPDGEIVRCWLPWPREIHQRQRDVRLLKTVPEIHFIAPDSAEQRSLYLEQPAVKGKAVVFELQFEYLSMAQYFDLTKIETVAADPSLQIDERYTAEQPPQIVFTDQIRKLSDSIVSGSSTQAEKVKKIYYWINNHIIWTGALEYSIIPFIPGYVLANGRGDCGMQTLLFMSMARYQHIPVKWQSGWMMHPGSVNLHDWCEVYYERVGWVPLDMSFNLQVSDKLSEKEFYISGIDSYRLIVNDAISCPLIPAKKYYRSEPFDFQRGEVEWRGGNLYFNQWDYHMKVDYQDR